MTRLVDHRDMTRQEILECSYEALAIVSTCAMALDGINEENVDKTAGDIALALRSALELLGPVHDALESHEGMAGKK